MTSLFPGRWCRLRWCRRKAVIQAQRHRFQAKRRWPGSNSNTLREHKSTGDETYSWKEKLNTSRAAALVHLSDAGLLVWKNNKNRICAAATDLIALFSVWARMSGLLTPVADHAYRWRGEDEETFPKQRKLPQHHYLLPEELDELGHAASWVGDLQGGKYIYIYLYIYI